VLHLVACLVDLGGRFLLVIFKQSLNFILEPVSEVIEVPVLKQLLCGWPLLRVHSQTLSREVNCGIVAKTTESVLKQAVRVLILVSGRKLYAFKQIVLLENCLELRREAFLVLKHAKDQTQHVYI
jgi:hypothetical protein